MEQMSAEEHLVLRLEEAGLGRAEYYTTGDVARVLRCSPDTVVNLIEGGVLEAFVPNVHRRVTYSALVAHFGRGG